MVSSTKFQPREYALEAERDVLQHVKTSVEPAVVEATVSFGKSFLIANLADKITKMSGKKVLILCPSGNLVTQNKEKVIAIGRPCSVFSASSGQKSTRHDIVCGTPQTIKNSLSRFGSQFAAILIDEGEGLTTAVRAIAERIKDENPNVRIIGFTGTPWRTGTGFVYRLDVDGKPVPQDQAINPFYTQCIHRCDTNKLMRLGYLTPMVVGSPNAGRYNTDGMTANASGNFRKSDVDRAYHGHGRLTAQIVADIVAQSAGKNGVMIFAATVQHAKEVLASLPPDLSTICVGSGPDAKQAIADFKAQRKKYIVNVDKLTVGADFPHVDVEAVLRKTSSSRLLQQILGRGVRLLDGSIGNLPTVEERKAAIAASAKPFCLYLDYTSDNFDTHFPDGDIWSPVITTVIPSSGGGTIHAICPTCNGENEFSARPNPDEYPVDENGYFLDLAGERIEVENVGPMPAHYGRRCMHYHPIGGGKMEQCGGRWTSKECLECGNLVDIAARYCPKGHEIVDPNKALDMKWRQLKKDPYQPQCDVVTKWEAKDTVSQSGKDTTRIDVVTEHRSFSVWIPKEPRHPSALHQRELVDALDGKPQTVRYVKEQSGFFRFMGFNLPHDVNEADQRALEFMK